MVICKGGDMIIKAHMKHFLFSILLLALFTYIGSGIASAQDCSSPGLRINRLADNVSVTTTGTKLSYTVPVGRSAVSFSRTYFSSGSATIAFTLNGVTINRVVGGSLFDGNWISLESGDTIAAVVVAKGTATTADFSISVVECSS
jgi:hypothetical protein